MIEVSRRQMILSTAALAAMANSGAAFAISQANAAATGAQWDLTDLYPSDSAWEAKRKELLAQVPRLTGYKGTLGKSAASLRTALQGISDAYRETVRLYIYASLKADEDLRIGANQERKQQAQDVFTALGEATSWVNPEVLRVGAPRIRSFVRAVRGLG
jgi:oligoendopeptidase F